MSVQTSTQSTALPIMVIGELVEFKPRDVLSDILSVKNQQFIQANIPPGGTAIIETDTYFDVPHRILFDYLEFNDGQTLSICCLRPFFEPYELFCPFISESRSSPIMWRTQRVTCPVGTIKIMFICENFGRQAGSCSIDNVRLHKSNDILDLEPCQKDLLRSL
ncbi:unnamed protein product [Anisakis simplex]|uniref:Uncharacterized protein n=1 Tax=Anisakis simplex TaxID=6269 RepID=A0A0M3K4Z4_ANISI|nr:unnamed protein product [Anisakis simplex]